MACSHALLISLVPPPGEVHLLAGTTYRPKEIMCSIIKSDFLHVYDVASLLYQFDSS